MRTEANVPIELIANDGVECAVRHAGRLGLGDDPQLQATVCGRLIELHVLQRDILAVETDAKIFLLDRHR